MEKDGKLRDAVRVLRLKIVAPSAEEVARWSEIAVLAQRVRNRMTHEWWGWHTDRGHDGLIREWLAEFTRLARARQEASEAFYKERGGKRNAADAHRLKRQCQAHLKKLGIGKPPSCPVHPAPGECRNHVQRRLEAIYPAIHCKVLSATLKIFFDDLVRHKSMKSRFKKWHRILADLGEQSSFAQAQPIVLIAGRTYLECTGRPEDDAAEWRMRFRIDRRESVAGNGAPKITSTEEDVAIRTFGKRLAGIRVTLRRIARGEDKQIGSSLIQRDGAWYIHLGYHRPNPKRPEVDPTRRAVLRAAGDHPWDLDVGSDDSIWLLGALRLLPWHRRRLASMRSTRREATKSNKGGHGHDGREHCFRNRLAAYKVTVMQRTAAKAVEILLDRGIGKLVLVEPAGETYLEGAGNHAGARDGWPWDQQKGILAMACQNAGLDFSVVTDAQLKTGPEVAPDEVE